MFYLLNSLNIVRLLTEQTRAAQLPLSSQSESMYYAKKMDFWLINLIVIYNNQSCWQKANIEGFLVTQRGISLGGNEKTYKKLTFQKGVFFSESEIRFSNLPPKIFQKLSWAWNCNKMFTDMGGNFKFQAKDSFLE